MTTSANWQALYERADARVRHLEAKIARRSERLKAAIEEVERLRVALDVIDSGKHVPENGPPEWQEYAMYVQVVAGGALGRVG